LGVHEGPCGISKYNKTIFEPNMIVTNEPGYYENGKYGIRIENILVAKEDKEFYGFECLTLCPYDLNLIDESLLTKKDRECINKYHARVRETLVPLLKEDNESV
jgi:Xaa-Pro aminopeptidase